MKDKEDLFDGDIKLTPQQKAILQSDDATIENWRRVAQKWKRDGIPYVLDSSLCMLLDRLTTSCDYSIYSYSLRMK